MPTRKARASSSVSRKERPKFQRSRRRGFRKLTNGERRSKYEVEVIEGLESRGYKEGQDWTYEGCKIPYTIDAFYIPDIILFGRIYVELKGYLPYSDRRKLECVRRSNPNLDLRIVFSRDNPIRKNSAQKYSDWAERVGIPWAIGRRIPEDWLE